MLTCSWHYDGQEVVLRLVNLLHYTHRYHSWIVPEYSRFGMSLLDITKAFE
jgi:hypothetical protein